MFKLYGYFIYLYARSNVKITQPRWNFTNGKSIRGSYLASKGGKPQSHSTHHCSRMTESRRLSSVSQGETSIQAKGGKGSLKPVPNLVTPAFCPGSLTPAWLLCSSKPYNVYPII